MTLELLTKRTCQNACVFVAELEIEILLQAHKLSKPKIKAFLGKTLDQCILHKTCKNAGFCYRLDSVLIWENKGKRKPVFSQILRGSSKKVIDTNATSIDVLLGITSPKESTQLPMRYVKDKNYLPKRHH